MLTGSVAPPELLMVCGFLNYPQPLMSKGGMWNGIISNCDVLGEKQHIQLSRFYFMPIIIY